jgi:hypothetical protein
MTRSQRKIYAATQILFRAFTYLEPRIEAGEKLPAETMTAEELACRILHGCMVRLLGDIRQKGQGPSLA